MTDGKLCMYCGTIFQRDPRYSRKYFQRAKFCSQACSARAQSERAEAARAPMMVDFRRWFVEGPGCWEWHGARDRDGYGIFGYAGKARRAPRVALQLDGRPVPRGMYACHHCDNPACVRPSHLYVGKPVDNSRDRILRRRMPIGTQVYNAKLTERDVLEIRHSNESASALARRFGVSRSNVYAVRDRLTWRHVQ